MVFLGIVLIILCLLLLFDALNNINKIDSELKKKKLKNFQKSL